MVNIYVARRCPLGSIIRCYNAFICNYSEESCRKESNSQTHVPEVAAHDESVTTPVPSRFRTVSRVSQFPEMVSHVGNKSRE